MMTLNIGLSSVSLNLPESLVSCLKITLTHFDFLDFRKFGGKTFAVFSRSASSRSTII